MSLATRVKGSSNPAVDPAAADAACRALAGSHYENFDVVGSLVPRELRPHLARLYAFCRHTDDLGDEGGGSVEDRLEQLADWAVDLERCWGGQPEHPYLVALTHSVRELGLPREPFFRLVEANRMDQRKTSYDTFADLIYYCRHSADPVGEMVLHAVGAATPETIALSDSICTGLQLANFWQDVRVDRDKGRRYIPHEDMARFGVTEADLASSIASEAFRRLMEFEVERARQMLLAGTPLVRLAPRSLRPALGGFVRGGLAILDRIAQQRHDVLARRPEVSRLTKVGIAVRTLASQAIGGW